MTPSVAHQDAPEGLVATPLFDERDSNLVLGDHALGDQQFLDSLPGRSSAAWGGLP